ncbi:MAG: LysM peptidoglycan-binding domain-containing protein [Deltaproteobacteria bacterium]
MTHRKPLGTAGACILLVFSLFGCASNHTQGNHSRHIPGTSSISCLHVPDPSGPSASSVADSSLCNWEEIRKLVEDARSAWKAERPDEALDIIDIAYARLAEISPKTPEEEGEKNEIRIELAHLIQEIHASNQTSTKGLASEIPCPLTPEVEEEIRQFQGPERKFFLDAYLRSLRYRPLIADALRKEGLPEELSWIPLIESGFQNKATSTQRALGLWQFIPSTGEKYGLKRTTWIDERMDPEKSTQAAISYLKELHRMFGDWTTVLAAYNCGEGTVLKKIRTQKIDYLDNFWDLYAVLPRETARFVPRFLAVLHIVNDPQRYGFSLDELEGSREFAYETALIDKPVSLEAIAENLDIPLKELEEYNPELRLKVTPDHPYRIKLPMGFADKLAASIHDLPTCRIPQPSQPTASATGKGEKAEGKSVKHVVAHGETLGSIAKKYGVSVREIAKTNRLGNKSKLIAGTTLTLLTAGDRKPSGKERHSGHADAKQYVVKKGDTLDDIAKRFRTSASAVKKMNGLSSSKVKIGQKLLVPSVQ